VDGHDTVVVGEDGLAMGDCHQVDVDVDHPRLRRGALGDLMHVADRGDAGAEVEKLADTSGGEEPDRPAQERPVGPVDRRQARYRRVHLCGNLPIDGEFVLARP
jgi:hypothetical protein